MGAILFLLGSAGRPGSEGTITSGMQRVAGTLGPRPSRCGERGEPGERLPPLALGPLWWGLL